MSTPVDLPHNESIVHVAPDTPSDEILSIYLRDRALIIDGLTDEATVAQLRQELEGPLSQATMSARGDDFMGQKTKRVGALVTCVPACRELVIHPQILGLAKSVLGQKASIQLNATQGMAVQPGETRQPLHRDRGVWATLPLPPDFECVLNCMWAIDNFNPAGGATHLVPGSFDYPNCPDPRVPDARLRDGRLMADLETVQADMSAGSVLVFSGNIYHGAGANRSDRPRIGMAIAYSPATLRQEENQYLSVPPDIARNLPEPLQQLLGYELGDYALGFVGNNMESPMSLLR